MPRLPAEQHERVWGSLDLAPYFVREKRGPVGEVWFQGPPQLPLLIKFLFTNDKLSVQVHPDDAYASVHHSGSPGKTEMWRVLAAEPGARIAAGFHEKISEERLKSAACSGEIEKLLRWHDARPGDTFFIPAGTVHAIGPGLTLCEIQQNSDITYRLYDYGRVGLDGKPRELHLEHGLRVSRREPYDPRRGSVVSCPHFTTEHLRIDAPRRIHPQRCEIWIAIEGSGEIGGERFTAGEVWSFNQARDLEVSGSAEILRCYGPRAAVP